MFSESGEEDRGHGEPVPAGDDFGESFVVAGQSQRATEPGERSFDDPSSIGAGVSNREYFASDSAVQAADGQRCIDFDSRRERRLTEAPSPVERRSPPSRRAAVQARAVGASEPCSYRLPGCSRPTQPENRGPIRS